MKLLFVHDHIFGCTSDGGVFSPGKLTTNSWTRYLLPDVELCILARSQELPNGVPIGWSDSSASHTHFCLLRSRSGLFGELLWRYSQARSAVRNAVLSADMLIVRLPSRIGHAAILEAISLGRPYAIELVGCPFDSYSNYGGFVAKFLAPFAWIETRIDVASASHVLYVTNQFLQARYPTKGKQVAISNVELPKLNAKVANDGTDSNGTGVIFQTIIVGFIGDINLSYKGFETLVKAVALARRISNFDFQVDIAGSKSFDSMAELITQHGLVEQVVCRGVLKRGAGLSDWFQSVDLFVCPSLTEGLPRALIEAMASGLPCIGSTAGGIPELLDPALLFKPRDHGHLARLLLELASNPNLREMQSVRNANEARRYSNELLEVSRKLFWATFYHDSSLTNAAR